MSRLRRRYSPPARRLRGGLGGLVATLLVLLGATAAPAPAAPFAISDGELEWNVKESWRDYISAGSSVGDGAEISGWTEDSAGNAYAEGFTFPVASGSYDEETETTVIEFDGYVHFQAWYGLLAPEKYALDTKYSDLEVVIGPDEQVLRGTHTGYLRTDPGGELVEDHDVVLARFDITGASTDFSGGVSAWTEIPTVAGPGLSIYGESTVIDPTSFQYTGPGGVPDLRESWDAPGTPGLEPGAAWLADASSKARVLHASLRDDVVHTVDLIASKTVNARLVVAAYDAQTLAPVGTPYTWAFPGAIAGDRQELRTAFDPETDSVFFVTFNEGEARNQASVRRAVWDPQTQSYAVEAVGGLGALTTSRRVHGLAWNPVEDELAAIAYSGSSADIYATDTLHRFHLDAGSWVHEQTSLRLPDDGEWAGATAVTSPFAAGSIIERDEEALAVARDGSYVGAPRTGSATVSGSRRYYPAMHVTVAGDGSATVAPIDGTTTPRTAIGTYFGFASLAVAEDGSLLLHNSEQVMDAYARIDIEAGEAVRVGAIVDAPEDVFAPYEIAGFANSMVADATRGRTWVTDTLSTKGHRLHALEGGEIVASYVYADFPELNANGGYARLELAADGSVYMPVKDPGSGRLGYRRLAFTGIVPAVTAQPADRLAVLGAGEQSEPVQFTVEIADPADSIQWQTSAPGQAAFTDVAGATGPTLEVDATRAHDGRTYRAKVTNQAGAVVSDAVALNVDYAPAIVTDLTNRTVVAGADAVFLLSVDSDPEAAVEWQRRVGGFWQPIAPGDDNFELDDSSLTVLDTNVEQSGSLFRAKLSNSVGSVHSKQAKLTVTPSVEIPDEGVEIEHATLDWTGNEEMQKAPPFGGSNYFSAGVSAGSEATYSAASGKVRVFQVGTGGETLATYATRAGHVGNGGSQLVRLYEGGGRVEADGSATVAWEGAFSVNFYGGLAPFTLVDPELEVDSGGAGTLSADLIGCASSQANPNVCDPLPPVPDVAVATFSGVEIDPGGAVSIAPAYEGVEVEVPAGETPQNRVAAGWGAWPQPFVDFHLETGLASYWYSSGGSFDAYKAPHPLLVDFDGEALPVAPDPVAPDPVAPGTGAATPTDRSAGPAPRLRAGAVANGVRRQRLGKGRRAVVVARLACPAGGAACRVQVPRRMRVKVGDRRFGARVVAPRRVRPGTGAKVRVRLPKPALLALREGRRTRLAVRVVLRQGDAKASRMARVQVRG